MYVYCIVVYKGSMVMEVYVSGKSIIVYLHAKEFMSFTHTLYFKYAYVNVFFSFVQRNNKCKNVYCITTRCTVARLYFAYFSSLWTETNKDKQHGGLRRQTSSQETKERRQISNQETKERRQTSSQETKDRRTRTELSRTKTELSRQQSRDSSQKLRPYTDEELRSHEFGGTELVGAKVPILTRTESEPQGRVEKRREQCEKKIGIKELKVS